MPFLRRLAFAPFVCLAIGLIVDGIVSLIDPHVPTSSAQAW
jgi:hypothetical protein